MTNDVNPHSYETTRDEKGYIIRFRVQAVNLATYNEIETIVEECVRKDLALKIDLSGVGWANGDFFGFLAAAYLKNVTRDKIPEAVERLKASLTLVMNPNTSAYRTAHADLQELVTYELREDAA